MNKLAIPHGGLVLVGDGRKALFLRNAGDVLSPNLQPEKAFEDDNPATREQGSDRPGRTADAILGGRRSAFEATDWHKIEQHHFAQRVAAAAAELVRATKPTQFIVIAPPKTLADLRKMFSADVEALVVVEIDKNLTHLSVGEIEQYLVGED